MPNNRGATSNNGEKIGDYAGNPAQPFAPAPGGDGIDHLAEALKRPSLRESHILPAAEPDACAQTAASDTTSDVIVERLIAWGVERVFGMVGDGVNIFVNAIRKREDQIKLIDVRHEEAAAFMACGHAKYTKRLGVCLGTSGPGAIHLLNGLYDARMDGAPVLAITGMPFSDVLGAHYVQEVNPSRLMDGVASYNVMIGNPLQALSAVDLACRTALGGNCVSHLAIPKDVQMAPLAGAHPSEDRGSIVGTASWVPPLCVPREEQLRAVADLLNNGTKIMILAGQGALGASRELEQAAEILGAPVAKALLGRTVLDDDSPLTTGGIGDLGTHPSQMLMKECDTLLILGSTMPYPYYPEPGQARCVQIDRDPAKIGVRYPPEIGLVADCQATLSALLPMLERNRDRRFLERAQHEMEKWRNMVEVIEERKSAPVKPQFLAAAVSRLMEPDAAIAIDTGAHTLFAARHLRLSEKNALAVSGNLSSMGPALPYAIAAQLAFPERQCIALAGDGGLTMLMGEIATAVKHKLPVKVIVFRNNNLALEVEEQRKLGNPLYGCELQPIDFAGVARACGAEGFTCRTSEEVEPALMKAFSAGGPAIVDVHVDPHELPAKPDKVSLKH
jgi:thiamine pyrophosphate-dependent acetolactate synthase large subunit-like protein